MGEYRKLTTNKGKEVIGIIKSLRGIKNTNRLPPQAIKYDRHFCRLKIKNVVFQSLRMAYVSERGREGKGRFFFLACNRLRSAVCACKFQEILCQSVQCPRSLSLANSYLDDLFCFPFQTCSLSWFRQWRIPFVYWRFKVWKHCSRRELTRAKEEEK